MTRSAVIRLTAAEIFKDLYMRCLLGRDLSLEKLAVTENQNW